MANLEPILKTWNKYLEEDNIYKWCESINFLLEIFQSDNEFKATIIDEANKLFINKLDNDDRSDAFFYLLGKMK